MGTRAGSRHRPAPTSGRLVALTEVAAQLQVSRQTVERRAARVGVALWAYEPTMHWRQVSHAGGLDPGAVVLRAEDVAAVAGAGRRRVVEAHAEPEPAPLAPIAHGWQGLNVSAAHLGAHLAPGAWRAGLWDGHWAVIDLLELVAAQEGPEATLHMALWATRDGAHLPRLRALTASGVIGRIQLYVDRTMTGRHRDSAKRLADLFGDLKTWPCHGKFAAFVGGRLGSVVDVSSNLHAVRRIDAGAVRCDSALAEQVVEAAEHVHAGGSTSPGALLEDLAPGRAQAGLSSHPGAQRWCAMDLVDELVARAGPSAHLDLVMHNVAPEHALRLRQVLDSGRIAGLRVAVDQGMRNRHRDRAEAVAAALPPECLRWWATHTKVIAVHGGALDCVVASSANLGNNPRIESYVAYAEAGMGAGWRDLVDDIWAWQPAGSGLGAAERYRWTDQDSIDLLGPRLEPKTEPETEPEPEPEQPPGGLLVTLTEAARRLHVSRATVERRAARRGVEVLRYDPVHDHLRRSGGGRFDAGGRVLLAADVAGRLAAVDDAQLPLLGGLEAAPDHEEESGEWLPALYEGYRPASAEHDPCTDYARSVVAGRTVAGPYVRAACERHLRDLRRYMTHDRRGRCTYRQRRGARRYFSLPAYERFRNFAGRLRLWRAQYAGEPLVLHPMQEFVVGSLFGWLEWREGDPRGKPARWLRRFRRAYLEIGKGNAKTPLMAVMGLYGMLADGEPAADVFLGGAKRDQAQLVMNDAAGIVSASGLGDVRATGVTPTYRLTHLPSRSTMTLLSRDSGKTESGITPHMAMLDEVHEHADARLVSMVTRGLKWRRQPLIVMATNSGYADVDSVALEEHEAAVKLLTGGYEAEDTFAYVCALDAGDDPFRDESCWVKANPMLGTAQSVTAIRQAVADAGMFPSRRADVDRLHFCRWSGAGAATWMSGALWGEVEVDEGLEALRGLEVVLAVDLSESGDMTALTWMAAVDSTDEGRDVYHATPWAYLPAQDLRERAARDKRPYPKWAQEGHLRTTPGRTVELTDVADDVLAAREEYALDVIAVIYDGWRFRRFREALEGAGEWDCAWADHPQGFGPRKGSALRMSASVGYLERIVAARRLRVTASPVMRSAVAGAVQRLSDTGQARWTKSASRVRIDALVSLTMACGAWEAMSGETVE